MMIPYSLRNCKMTFMIKKLIGMIKNFGKNKLKLSVMYML